MRLRTPPAIPFALVDYIDRMSGNEPTSRRPGPIGFNAESSVTGIRASTGKTRDGIGTASAPAKETVRGSKELKVVAPTMYAAMGALFMVTGLLWWIASPRVISGIGVAPLLLLAIGAMVLIAAGSMVRRNRTEQRLRSQFESESP